MEDALSDIERKDLERRERQIDKSIEANPAGLLKMAEAVREMERIARGDIAYIHTTSKSLERTRAGQVSWQCGRAGSPASLSSVVSLHRTIT
jgi:hypothetical protein